MSGNFNAAALQIVNASNIQVGSTATGVPIVVAPNIAALTSASNTAGAAAKTSEVPTGSSGDRPSIIIVEILGYGGDNGGESDQPGEGPQPAKHSSRSYNVNSPVQVIGSGELTASQKQQLTTSEQANYEAALK